MVNVKLGGHSIDVQLHDDTQLPDSVEELVSLLAQIDNSLKHLKRSNEEILAFDPKKEDSDLQAALIENQLVIINRERTHNRIISKLNELRSKGIAVPLLEELALLN